MDAGAGRVRVAELSALDEDAGDRHVFRVSDTAILEVIDAALYLKQGAALDYETAPSHRFTVTATDSGGLRFTGPEQTLTVADANAAPTGVGVDWVVPAADGVIAEDVDAGAGRVRVAELSALDEDAGDRHVFRVSDTAILEVIDDALYLKQGAALDYETAASHRFTVTATDSGGLRFTGPEQTLTVADANEAPTGVGVDWVVPAADGVIAEDVDAGAGRVRVAELSALDEDAGDRHVFRVSDTAILEVIDAALYLKQGAALDYETAPSHRFTVTATDSGGLRFTGPEQTLTVADANEAPTGVGVDWVVPAADGVIAEDVDAGAGRVRVAELSALDEDAGDRHVFRVSDTAILEVIDDALYLKQGAALDYETAASHRFTVTATDSGGLRFTGPEQTLTVADANEAPTGVGVDWVVPAADGVIAEDVDAGAGRVRVAELSALDEDAGDRHVFRVSDTAILEVIDDALYLKQGAALDYETAASHRFTVTATDSGGLRFTGPEQTLTVADANEAPTGVGVDWVVPAADGVIAEDVDAGAGRVRVAELSALDEDAGDRHVFRVSDTAILEVIDDALYLKQGAALDYETAASHRFTVTATDSGGLRFTGPEQTLTVADANEAPTGVGVDWVVPAADGVIAEDVDAGAGRVRVAELSALDEDAGDRHVFRVSDTAILEVIDDALYLKQGAALDYETAPSHRFTVTATDSGGLRFTGPEQTLTVIDANEAPAFGQGHYAFELAENRLGPVELGAVRATDPDAGDALTYSIAGGGMGRFAIDAASGAIVYTGLGEDREGPSDRHELRVTATDRGGLSGGAGVTVTVVDETDAVARARLRRVNAAVLPELTRVAVSGAVDAVARRIRDADPRAPAGREENALARYLLDIVQALGAGGPAPDEETMDGTPAPDEGMMAGREAPDERPMDWKRVLADSSFVLTVGDKDREGDADPARSPGGVTLWGEGDWRALSAGGAEAPVEFEGDVMSARLGIDRKWRADLLTGLALSWSRGSFDWVDRGEAGYRVLSGRHESRMTSLYPYVGWWPRERLGLWGTAGHGRGEVWIEDEEAGRQSSDAALSAAAVGGRAVLFSGGEITWGGATSLALKSEAWLARFEVEGNGDRMAALAVNARRLRLGLEGEYACELSSGATLTPSLELGLRHDGGDGETGYGVEVGGELRWSAPRGRLTGAVHSRVLLAHRGDLEEWGVGFQVTLDPGVGGRGLSLRLNPSWGAVGSGLERLWEDGLAAANPRGTRPPSRLDAEIGYGFGAGATRGVLTPYGGLTLSGGGERLHRLGARLEIGPSVNFNLEVRRREGLPDAPADHGVLLQGTANW